MTLNLMIINQWGIWQSADYRATDPNSGKVIDDYLPKQIALHCPDGSALLALAGVASVRNVQIAQWVVQILRGEARTLDQSLILLRERATEDLGPIVEGRYCHMFTVGAVIGGHLWAVQIRNFEIASSGPVVSRSRNFNTVAKQITGAGMYFAVPPEHVTPENISTLAKVAKVKPRKPKEIRYLVAAINRRAAATKGIGRVRPHCATAYLPPEGRPFEREIHDVQGWQELVIPHMLLLGTDTQYHFKFAAQSYAAMRGEGTVDNSKGTLDRLGHEAVTPRNPLRGRR